ncbi:DUF4360 domain-containing protein [Oligoflexus tunisiensis]|uniref:DUF4360 domain-containing protein n=1 Tax=Oligoflexus tunisiensis TaxID=708132 RepID=UPI00114C8650|nr:DUF4360 domain-containing protein [Oligoflexus tunisiensis]
MKTLTALALVLGFASFAQAGIELDVTHPLTVGSTRFGVESVTFNGTGCAGGKGTGYLVQNDILWLKFADDQTAKTGPGTSLSASRRNCAATINFKDSNRSYAIDAVAFYVEADLPAENTANVTVNWFYAGQGQTGSFTKTLDGDYSGVWTNTFQGAVSGDVWKPCGADRALTVNGAIRVSGPREHESIAQWQILGIRLKSRSC